MIPANRILPPDKICHKCGMHCPSRDHSSPHQIKHEVCCCVFELGAFRQRGMEDSSFRLSEVCTSFVVSREVFSKVLSRGPVLISGAFLFIQGLFRPVCVGDFYCLV